MTVIQITFSIVCITASVVTNSSDNGVLKWKNHYSSVKKVAQAAKRPMLLVLENPTSKGGTIDDSKLTEKEREILTKGKFELCRVDVNTDYGKRVAAAFGARVFPYTVVTDHSSKRIVFRKPGQMSGQDWALALAKSTRTSPVQPTTVKVTTPVAPGIVNQPRVISGRQVWTKIGAATDGVINPGFAPAVGTCFT